jgi:hypothetical protein
MAIGYTGLRAAQEWTRRHTEAEGRVDALTTAEVHAIPGILKELGQDRRLVRNRLVQMARDGGPGADVRRRLPAALALLPDDPAQADFLTQYLLHPGTPPDELLVIRDSLAVPLHASRVQPQMQRVLPSQAAELSDE